MDRTNPPPPHVDATPSGERRDDYGLSYLSNAGHVSDPRTRTDEYAPGHEIAFVACPEGRTRIGYFEVSFGSLGSSPTEIAVGLGRRTPLDHFWFRDPETGRIEVVRTTRGRRRFGYDPRHGGETTERKRARLERARDDVNALFDERPASERFLDELTEHRSALADALTVEGGELTDRTRLLAAQRLVDRLLTLSFLVENGLVGLVNDEGEPAATGGTLANIVREADDFREVLDTVSFEALNRNGTATLRVSDSHRLRCPYFGSVFDPSELETRNGSPLDERELEVEGYDWSGPVEACEKFRWTLSGSFGAGGRPDIETLTPAVFERLCETVVVPASEADDSLSDLRASPSNRLPEGNGNLGAYYTDEEVTYFVVRRALWAALRARIEADVAAGRVPDALDDGDLYRPAHGRRDRIEANGLTGFDALYESHGDDPEVLRYVDGKLRSLTVCDPAVGGGAFVLAAANTLLEWRSACVPDADEYALRREIVANSVFGVDALDAATRTCRLRLRLWVGGALPPESEGCESEPPPNPELTVRTGNGLVGFASVDEDGLGSLVADLEAHGRRTRNAGRDDGNPRTGTPLERRAELRSTLDERYAEVQSDPDGDEPLTVSDRVDSVTEATRNLDAAPSTLVVEVEDGIPDESRARLSRLGFTTYRYRARLDAPELGRDELAGLFDHLGRTVDGERGAAWSIIVERPYAGRDFGRDRLDACHWPLEFPPVAEEGGFDVVVGNPPYGATVAPEARPLLRSERAYRCQGASDTCEWFYERAFDLARDGGVVAYVVNKSVAFYANWRDVRRMLLREAQLEHVFDIGLGFSDVNLETVAMVHALGDGPFDGTATVHRSEDLRRPKNGPVHLGWADQSLMRDAGTVAFRPTTDAERTVLRRLLDAERRLGDVASGTPTRQLYVPDGEKRRLKPGDDAFVHRNPWVLDHHLADVWHCDLDDYRDAVERYAVPRVMLKVLRGSRLRAWLDERGETVGTEKLVAVPFEDATPDRIAFVYAALNHPCASFYLQKATFSETTETARVMDRTYSEPIPIPDATNREERAVATLARTLTMAKQLHHDGTADFEAEGAVLQSGLEAFVGSLALFPETHRDERAAWTRALDANRLGPRAVADRFASFYTDRYARRDGRPERHRDAVGASVVDGARIVSEWDVDRIVESSEMGTVLGVL